MSDEEQKASPDERFIAWLEALVREDTQDGARRPRERAVLAALRRGLGKPPGSVIEMYPYLMPFVGRRSPSEQGPDPSRRQLEQYSIVASLFASHPTAGGTGNMGTVMAAVREKTGSDSVEKRFVALLNCHRDNLHDHLRHAVSLARANDVPINWPILLRDIRFWDPDDRSVQRRWAKEFWSGRPENEEE
ncbi:MAG: type I-E CRISPR-associated protein Cse2/CasB [Actinobacteria bacterium]|nr:type I-E CRISPR-associated protein Cse2/CasB [Actinomycetota bacterium]